MTEVFNLDIERTSYCTSKVHLNVWHRINRGLARTLESKVDRALGCLIWYPKTPLARNWNATDVSEAFNWYWVRFVRMSKCQYSTLSPPTIGNLHCRSIRVEKSIAWVYKRWLKRCSRWKNQLFDRSGTFFPQAFEVCDHVFSRKFSDEGSSTPNGHLHLNTFDLESSDSHEGLWGTFKIRTAWHSNIPVCTTSFNLKVRCSSWKIQISTWRFTTCRSKLLVNPAILESKRQVKIVVMAAQVERECAQVFARHKFWSSTLERMEHHLWRFITRHRRFRGRGGRDLSVENEQIKRQREGNVFQPSNFWSYVGQIL